MASFTDAISQFNPYVAQLPVEAMAKVGMQKQAQYEQGVQKIQAYIDNVAGMDVAHDADKSYLQSKMNQLGNNLKVVAGGDFSNQQLVNSVGGMATQIIKDPNIQNAVASTAWYKKQKEKLDDAYQSGKSSIANVKDFERQASAWLSKDEVGQTFRGKYSPYIDLSKKWNEVIKAVHPMASSEDFAYEKFVDNKGVVHSDKLAAAMTRITKEGISSDQIENAIRASLTPDDMNQMKIDATYRFEGIDSDAMKSVLTSNYDTKMKQLDDAEKMINQAITVVGGDPVQKEFATKSLNALSNKRLQLKQSLQSDLSLADSNLDAVKTNFYKEGAIDQTASAFSWEKKAKELLTNPLLQAQFERERIDISKATLQETKRQNLYSNWISGENLKISREKLSLDRDKALEEKFGVASGFTTLLGEGTKNLLDPVSAITSDVLALKNSNLTAMQQLGGGNVNVAKALIETYKKDVSKVQPWQADQIEGILKNEQLAALKEKELTGAESVVLANDPSLRRRKEEIDSALNNNKPFNVTINGKRETFSPREIFDYVSKFKIYNTKGELYRSGQDAAGSNTVDPRSLTGREKILHAALDGKGVDNLSRGVIKQYSEIVQKDAALSSNLHNAASSYLSTTNGTYVPAVTGIVTDPKSKPFYQAAALSALSKYSMEGLGIKGGSAMLSNSDAKTASEWLSSEGKEKIEYQKLNYAGKQSLILTKEGKQIIIPLSADQEDKLPKLTGELNAFNQNINKIQIANGNYSTNPTNDVNKSYYQPWSMQTQGINAYADLHRSPNSPDIQYINLSVKNRQGEIYPLTIDRKLNASSADEFIKGLTNKDIKDLYLSNPSIPDSWKEQIKNL